VREWSTVTSSIAGLVRDVVVPVIGLLLIIGEARRDGEPRWELIVLYAGMIGLPGVTFLDWRQRAAPAVDPPAGVPPPSAPSRPATPP
jgi:hypothetical protein